MDPARQYKADALDVLACPIDERVFFIAFFLCAKAGEHGVNLFFPKPFKEWGFF